MGLLKTIFIILIVYYSVRLITRILLPVFLKMFVKRAQRNFEQQFNQTSEPPRKEGEVTVDFQPSSPSKAKSDRLGEYVDFEEVKED